MTKAELKIKILRNKGYHNHLSHIDEQIKLREKELEEVILKAYESGRPYVLLQDFLDLFDVHMHGSVFFRNAIRLHLYYEFNLEENHKNNDSTQIKIFKLPYFHDSNGKLKECLRC